MYGKTKPNTQTHPTTVTPRLRVNDVHENYILQNLVPSPTPPNSCQHKRWVWGLPWLHICFLATLPFWLHHHMQWLHFKLLTHTPPARQDEVILAVAPSEMRRWMCNLSTTLHHVGLLWGYWRTIGPCSESSFQTHNTHTHTHQIEGSPCMGQSHDHCGPAHNSSSPFGSCAISSLHGSTSYKIACTSGILI